MKGDLSIVHVADKNNPDRFYADFHIAGKSLKEWLGMKEASSVTRLGWFSAKTHSEFVQQLKLQKRSELPGGRVELSVCAACGDIGCGSVTMKIKDEGDRITWCDFAYQTDPNEIGERLTQEAIAFDRHAYFKVLNTINK